MSVFVRRTITSGPPPNLAFGEVAYSDEDQVLHVGRADEAATPTAFVGNPTDYGPDIEALTTDVAALETSQASQNTAISTLTTDVAALETSQGAQDTAIAALATDVATLQAAPPPVTGWDYIGPTEPLNPAVNFTWWETPAQKRWYWTGSVWASIQLFHSQRTRGPSNLINGASSSGNSGFTTLPGFDRPILLVEVAYLNGSWSIGGSNSLFLRLLGVNGSGLGSGQNTSGVTAPAGGAVTLREYPNQIFSSPTLEFRVEWVISGSLTIFLPTAAYTYRSLRLA